MTARQQAARWATMALPGLSVVCVVAGISVQWWSTGTVDAAMVLFVGPSLLYAVVGAIVLRRHPRHRVGWLLLLIGVLVTSGHLAEQLSLAAHLHGRDVPGAVAVASLWYMQWYWLPFVFAQFVGIPLLFPTGRPLSRAWGRFGVVILGVAVLATLGGMFGQRLMLDLEYLEVVRSFDNPVGFLPFDDIEGASTVMFVIVPLQVGGLTALASLALRYRGASGIERQQIKWGALGLGMTVGAFAVWAVLDGVLGTRLPVADGLTNAIAPIAMGLAITRYRLWDVDRLISRSVAYLGVTLVLAAGYAVLVVGVQGLGGQGDLPDLVVAAATLVAAAVVQPLRRRLQGAVDRRFHRSRYDAARVMERFGEGLRDEVDAGVVTGQMRRVVELTMQPAVSSVWLVGRTSR